jgi:potassium efflux system protein
MLSITFTSGLILLFEQKIKQADIIQCSGVNGKVANIGMRCSVVRTFDGAEVIVPNGQLVSAQVINWTHSDQERRITIPIGVAYGTDPQLAIDTLVKVARGNSDVLDDPQPVAFFVRFGPSSMDFELRAWVSNGEIINEINSRLCLEFINSFRQQKSAFLFPNKMCICGACRKALVTNHKYLLNKKARCCGLFYFIVLLTIYGHRPA